MLAELSQKVERLEARLDRFVPERADADSEIRWERVSERDTPAEDSEPAAVPDVPAGTASADSPADGSSSIVRWHEDEFPEPVASTAESRAESHAGSIPERSSRSERLRFDNISFEWLLGAKGLSLAGMLIVLVGVGMFLKYAFDEGWIASISPVMRCAAAAGFGAILLAAGEVLRRRINALASSGTSATGIAIIYAAILASSKLYQLIDTPTTFALLVGITVLGVALGSLSNRVMLALLSLVGAFLVPFMLESSAPSLVAMPSYLLSLLILGLVLAGWRGGPYANVRRLAWWGTSVIGTLWITTVYDSAPASALAFVVSVWLATVAELVVSARFFKKLRDRTDWPDRSSAGFVRDDDGEIRFDPASLFSPEARWLNSAFGVTAWAVITGAITVRQFDPTLDWLAPLGLGLASIAGAAVALGLGRKPAVLLWAVDPSPRSALAAALTLNGALLVVATVAMALGGWAQVATWGAIGLAAIETGRRLRFRAAGLFGFALLTLAAARLAVLDAGTHFQADPMAEPLGLPLTPWSGQVLYVSAAFAAGAWRSRYTAEHRSAAIASLWLLAATLLHPSASPSALGPVWLGLAAAAGWLTVRVRIMPLRYSAFGLGVIGMAVTLFGQVSQPDGLGSAVQLDLDPLSMCAAMLAWICFAAIPRLGYDARTIFAALAILSGGVAIASLYEARGVPETLLAAVGCSGILMILSIRLHRWSIIELVSIPLLVISAAWAINRGSVGGAAIEGVPVANVAFVVAVSTAALWIWLTRRLAEHPAADDAPDGLPLVRSHIVTGSLGTAWVLLLASTSIDVLRGVGNLLEERSAQGAALSIWWSLFAVASVAIGFRVSAALRWAGLVLLGVVAGKVLLLDTQTLAPPARIVAAITVGLVIIGAGVLYARLMKRADTKSRSTLDR